MINCRILGAAIALSLAAIAGPGAAAHAHGSADNKAVLKNHLSTFDNLDFDVFTNQKWDRLHESHDKNIVVYWPDGHHTTGIERHIQDLKAMFAYAPDIRIADHPIKIASFDAASSHATQLPGGRIKIQSVPAKSGEWTCVTGILHGTFTKPMDIGGGKTLPPTGKKFTLTMCTIGHWKHGVMVEEWLFWDTQTFMKQIGLG